MENPATAPRFPSRAYWIVLIFILILALAPVVSVFTAASLAESHGCRLDEGMPHPCIIAGSDWGETLYGMGLMGWVMMLSVPFGIVALIVWGIIRGIHRRAWEHRHGRAA